MRKSFFAFIALLSLNALSEDLHRPEISSVLTPADGKYQKNDNLDFTVLFNKSAYVTGTPHLALKVGDQIRYASYLSGSGSTTLVYRYHVSPTDLDLDGIEVDQSLDLHNGTIRTRYGQNFKLNFGQLDTRNILIMP